MLVSQVTIDQTMFSLVQFFPLGGACYEFQVSVFEGFTFYSCEEESRKIPPEITNFGTVAKVKSRDNFFPGLLSLSCDSIVIIAHWPNPPTLVPADTGDSAVLW